MRQQRDLISWIHDNAFKITLENSGWKAQKGSRRDITLLKDTKRQNDEGQMYNLTIFNIVH